MDDVESNGGSSYINVDLQPPSPRDQPIPLYEYTGSPYSDHSDLFFDPYDPHDFDGPNAANSLLMFDSFYRSPSPDGSDPNDDASRASSASSCVAQSFEGLSFSSPNWATEPLPPSPLPSSPLPPKPLPPSPLPPSPPRLLVDHVIDDHNDGPHLQVVPPTPVAAGAIASTPWLESVPRSPSPAVSSATTPGPSRSPSASPRPQPSPYLYPQPMRSRSKSETSLEAPDWQPQPQPQQPYPPTLGQNFSFGAVTDFLTPQFGAQLRRSRSDSANNTTRHRGGSRSEDFRFPTTDAFLTPNPTPFPPSSHDDFIRQQQLQRQQFLAPDLLLQQFTHPSVHQVPLQRAHYRSASTGSRPRAERGSNAAWDPALDVHAPGRMSPYPSPHASPRGRLVQLDRDDAFDFSAPQEQATATEDPGVPMTVSKPNVTTGRTANASQKRRKQEANFVCPVPGCGSTFTRSFNLKGHIRSHNEEKPFQCHWPGCGKGFARQHDCKRHEQLHTNYRPYNCEGCGKQFARMDALNRHLRSEGGADCVKQQEVGNVSAASESASRTQAQAQTKVQQSNGAAFAQGYGAQSGGATVVKKMEDSLPWGLPRLGVAL
ncbi:hypothetical protein C0989_010712 [Termitomyces sp. Mn162]|nr:hypothetical protein C0989_010712 [Termitomyces sp. Mn162]